jgi:hypothetical protein
MAKLPLTGPGLYIVRKRPTGELVGRFEADTEQHAVRLAMEAKHKVNLNTAYARRIK